MNIRIACILTACALYSWGVEARNVYVASPKVLRLGVQEKIGIAVDGTADQHFEVFVQDYPGKKKNLSHVAVTVSQENPEIATLLIEPEDIKDTILADTNDILYVSLVVHTNGFHKEAIIPLSFKSGYVFLQTDKPIYTPKQKVQFRIIALDEELRPVTDDVRFQIRNPKNVVVRETTEGGKKLQPGKVFIIPAPFAFSPTTLLGQWSATVLYGYKFQQNTTIEFEVNEYVLPTFWVKIIGPDVILPSDKIITFSVVAKYVYGKPVTGMASFRLGIQGQTPEATFFGHVPPKELQDGGLTVDINTEELKMHQNVGWFPDIEGFHFIIEANVTDTATGQKESARDKTGIFSKSPFVISFKRCLRDFKPGLMSIIEANVDYANGRPAAGVKTVLTGNANGNLHLRIYTNESTSDAQGRIQFEIHPEVHHNIVNFEVKTNDPKYGVHQTVGRFSQEKYRSKKKAYIAIVRRSRENVKPGTQFSEVVRIGDQLITDIYFLVTAKGKIVLMKKLPSGQFVNHRVEFEVTHEMVPNFRVLVFGHFEDELIADSRRVDVVNECNSMSNITVETDFETKKAGKISIQGYKDTAIGLLGIDSAVYALSDQGLLTRSKMFKTLENHDSGCGPGGGLTTDEILRNVGILLLTNHYSPSAEELSCQEHIRRKRHLASAKLSEYIGRLRQCCHLGMKKDLYDRTCQERTKILEKFLKENNENCSQVFLDCCLHKKKLLSVKTRPNSAGRRRTLVGEDFPDDLMLTEAQLEDYERNVNVRQYFRETWIFTDTTIRSNGKAEYHASLPDSITTWVVQTVAVSPYGGICVAPRKEIKSMKKLFVQLDLPYAVVRNEQVEIKATVFNYGAEKIMITVYMYGVKDLCSGFQEGQKSERKRLIIEPHSAQGVYFPVIPLKQGIYDIKVAAISEDGSDVIIRQLNVVPEGDPVEKHIVIPLDPSNQQNRPRRASNNDYSDFIDPSKKSQITAVTLRIPDDAIPGTETCVVSALGDQFGPTVETSLENPDSLLEGPRGCAEQNMIYFAPTLYTMRYLKSTGKITAEKEEKGYDLIRKGYSHQLNFRKPDGSFGAWINTPASVWLTAFVTKVFCQASDLVYIDPDIKCSGVTWLLRKQHFDGYFEEDNPVYHKDLMGGVTGKGPLTAYVLLTLEACQCDIDMEIPKARAVEYLVGNLGSINDPLPLAITAYALALSNSESKDAANSKLLALEKYNEESNTLHWGSGTAAANIEATSYALLTQLQLSDVEKSIPIVNWLNTQRFYSGRFQSTQDTIVALQALSEYAIRARFPRISLESNITLSSDRKFHRIFKFDENNAQILQELKLDKIGERLFIHTTGSGVGLLSVKLRYNVPTPPEKLCKFHITQDVSEVKERQALNADALINPQNKDTFVLYPDDLIRAAETVLDEEPDIEPEINPRNRQQRRSRIGLMDPVLQPEEQKQKDRLLRPKRENDRENSAVMYNIKICVRYFGDHETGMSIVDAGLFSGFKPNKEHLKELLAVPETLIESYDILSKNIVFYLKKIPNIEPYCFEFRIIQDYIVGNTQTSVIKVYDYYNPDESCTVFYRPDNNSPLLRKLCDKGICQCAEGGCPPKNPLLGMTRESVLYSACEGHNYVWKGKVMDLLRKRDGFLRIKFLVQEVFKEGIETAQMLEGETRELLARDSCDSAELRNQEYLLMGNDGVKYENEKGEIRYRYMLDKSSKIQKWVTFNNKKDKNLARDLDWLKRTLTKKGCEL